MVQHITHFSVFHYFQDGLAYNPSGHMTQFVVFRYLQDGSADNHLGYMQDHPAHNISQ